MNFELSHLFFAGVVYLLLLFFIAYATDLGWIPERIVRHPLTYALSLGVYATTWSFYGSVGFAQSNGYNFLSIYLGVTLAFALVPVLIAPMLRLARDYQLTSLADLFAFRYRSQLAGVIVTLFMLGGTLPYIALQILAVTESVQILTQEAPPHILALGFCLTLILFAILFGARHITPREKHEGLVVAIAFESLVKLFALCAVGVFALFGVFGGLGGVDDWLAENPAALESLYQPIREGPWTTLLLLSFCAAFLLPRQFHMTVTENLRERSLFVAAWAFPLFLLLLNLFIPIILWAGMRLQTGTSPDFYVLGITFASGDRLLPALAFIGGVSAASAMMIVTSLALASMCLNHLLLPARYPTPTVNLYRWLLWGRRTLIAVIILAGYAFYLVLQRNQGLVQLGLISFVAVAQFLPGVLGLLYWPRATRAGFLAGLTGGAALWAITLLLPLLERSGFPLVAPDLASWLGHAETDSWSFATFISLGTNAALFFGVSLLTRPSAEEREAAEACLMTTLSLPRGVVISASSPQQFEERLARILGTEAAGKEVSQALRDLGMSAAEQSPAELRRLRERIERNLSGLMGPMLSRMIVDERLQMDASTRSALADNIRFLEEKLEHSRTRLDGMAAELDSLRRYHQQILRSLPVGACSLGPDRKVISWNRAIESLSGIDRESARGMSVADLPEPWSSLFAKLLESATPHLHKCQAPINGRPRWFNLHKSAIEDPTTGGEGGGTVILVEDLTDVQTLEAELAHSERLASIGRLAAGVAHEIGNPVTGIACLAQNLRSETEDQSARDASQQILGQTERISSIVHSLVRFSHGGTHTEGAFSAVGLHDCIDEAARLVRLSHAGKQMEFRNQCPGPVQLFGDRQRLLQIFVNLLSNACDASQAGGRIEVSALEERSFVQVHVVDFGSGIPESLIDKVFEPFVTTKSPGQGTGLGLHMVYNIVREHGGSVSVTSDPGRGTRVTVRLPSKPSKTRTDRAEKASSA